jgi:hypothetical protein
LFDLIILLIEKRKREEKLDISIIIIIAYVFNYIMMIRNSLSNNNFSHRTSNDKNNTDLKKNKQLEFSSKHIVTKSITFNELCPIWAKKLSLGLDRIDKNMIERDSKYCIVGEAWKFSGRYY